jgi:hypothetical protein
MLIMPGKPARQIGSSGGGGAESAYASYICIHFTLI